MTEERRQQLFALQRAIGDLRQRADKLSTKEDPYAGLLLYEDAEQLEQLHKELSTG